MTSSHSGPLRPRIDSGLLWSLGMHFAWPRKIFNARSMGAALSVFIKTICYMTVASSAKPGNYYATVVLVESAF